MTNKYYKSGMYKHGYAYKFTVNTDSMSDFKIKTTITF